MAAAEDVERLLTDRTLRGKLYRLALRNLPVERRDSAADVVSEALLWTWLHREHVDNALAYAVYVCKIVARTWLVRNKDDCCGQLSNLYDAVTIGSSDFPNPADSVREMRSPELNPEEQLLEQERQALAETRRERIIEKLSPATRRNYYAWVERGYRANTHAQAIQGTRIRKALSKLSGGDGTRLHATHTSKHAAI